MVVFMLGVCLELAAASVVGVPASEVDALTPTAVRASSARPGFGPERLVDGQATTAWIPDAAGAFGLGQWVRFDFGREVAIRRVEVDNGVRGAVPDGEADAGGGAFCAFGRAATLLLHSDRGHPWLFELDRSGHMLSLAVGGLGMPREPLVTRSVTVRVAGVKQGFGHPGDVGLSEVRFFGAPADAAPVEDGPVACGSARLAELRDAVLARCARTYAQARPKAECARWLDALEFCADPELAPALAWLPIAPAAWSAGRLELALTDPAPPFPKLAATFERSAAGAWEASALSCLRGKAPCGLRHELAADGAREDREVVRPETCKALDGHIVRAP